MPFPFPSLPSLPLPPLAFKLSSASAATDEAGWPARAALNSANSARYWCTVAWLYMP